MRRKGFDRNARLGGEIRAVLAELLMYESKDPRLDSVTISVVKLSGDRSSAQVFFSIYGDVEKERQACDGFRAAASYFRRELGRRMRLRIVPILTFERDASYEYGANMDRLLERLHEEGALGTDEGGADTTREQGEDDE